MFYSGMDRNDRKSIDRIYGSVSYIGDRNSRSVALDNATKDPYTVPMSEPKIEFRTEIVFKRGESG